ncbi:Probable LIM domain-containing serine/threonine-protein kinase DDB [Seminavis robusta]|uniref:Probable LIM domain-containing serine/threonine-protein kinase DDB n=1 Tax=Seminavis robusta TaxID=568900 RepID=A0A9N8HQI3_9STRA|nr:Probable LIM domain-containing serine/threonine-protein kinase DDB [Seminavis robusta]|eukprot:Sro1290_g259860.1 Probable LIM domain-containing serine/threonine-protein kinase DDB (490) ;mRNA; r:28881-30350
MKSAKKRASFRGSFSSHGNDNADHCSNNNNQNNNNAIKRRHNSSFMKLPMKLLSSGKYPKTKIVKESIPALDDEIRVMTCDAPFMKSVAADSLCLLDRKEVIVGELLGQGQFAQVYEVKDLKLRDAATQELSPSQAAKRHSFVSNFRTCPTTHPHRCCSYAMKHLKKDLLISSTAKKHRRAASNSEAEIAAGDAELPMDQQFQLAAADLVVEALYMSRLAHPHILRVRGLAREGTAAFANGRYDSYFLILDKLSQTLDQRIRHWRHTLGQPQETQLCVKTEYAHQMAQALAHLHQRRIIYRDLKPANCGFKEEDGSLQIFDFGLCRELPKSKTNDTDPNEVYFMTAAGTHRYMAVEVLLGQKYNTKADVYSFSMVYYELLAQEAPFLNFDEAHHKKLVCERKHRPQHFFGCVVPLSIQNLLGDAWAHDIADRLTMAEVVARLEDILVNTFHRKLQDRPGGVKVALPDGGKKEEASSPPEQNQVMVSAGA